MLLDWSWECQPNQLYEFTPPDDFALSGDYDYATLATIFDCISGGAGEPIGAMRFMTLGDGCLSLLDLTGLEPLKNAEVSGITLGVKDCLDNLTLIGPECLGSVCVSDPNKLAGFGGFNACQCGGPCVPECPPNALKEGEPDCYDDYVDSTNGGCFSPFHAYFEVPCTGDPVTICGTTGAFFADIGDDLNVHQFSIREDGDVRSRGGFDNPWTDGQTFGPGGPKGGLWPDTDWYKICVAESSLVTATLDGAWEKFLVLGEFTACDSFAGQAYDMDSAGVCSTATVQAVLPPGEHIVYVAPLYPNPVPCGTPYVLTIDGCGPCGECETDQPVLVLGDVQTVNYTGPGGLWTVQVRLTNVGPGKAGMVSAVMGTDIPWLLIPDPTCYYGDLPAGAHSYGEAADPSYMFNLAGYPGGSFNVWFDVAYKDSCGVIHEVHLDPPFVNPATDVAPGDQALRAPKLHQARPNPFNPQTTLTIELPKAGHAALEIYDVSGRLVTTVWRGSLPAGPHSFVWKGLTDRGTNVPSGTYFYRFQADGMTETKRMTLIR